MQNVIKELCVNWKRESDNGCMNGKACSGDEIHSEMSKYEEEIKINL